jgi:hypothetical protein
MLEAVSGQFRSVRVRFFRKSSLEIRDRVCLTRRFEAIG